LQGLLQERQDVAAVAVAAAAAAAAAVVAAVAVDLEVQSASGEGGTVLVPEGSPGLVEDTILEGRHRAYSGIPVLEGNQGVQSVVRKVDSSPGTEVAEDSQEGLGEEVEIVAVVENMEGPEEGLVETYSIRAG